MSILIKGMKMPKTKECLVVAITDNGAFVLSETDGQIDYETIEIPDGHGRLIDASEKISVQMYDDQYEEWLIEEMTIDELLSRGWIDAEAPTVIPADKDGET